LQRHDEAAKAQRARRDVSDIAATYDEAAKMQRRDVSDIAADMTRQPLSEDAATTRVTS